MEEDNALEEGEVMQTNNFSLLCSKYLHFAFRFLTIPTPIPP